MAREEVAREKVAREGKRKRGKLINGMGSGGVAGKRSRGGWVDEGEGERGGERKGIGRGIFKLVEW